MNKLLCTVALVASSTVLAVMPAKAQQWPAKPIWFVNSSSAGTGTDIIARVLGDRLSQGLGQPVVHDNKPGAGHRIAAARVAKSAPDGYTMLITTASFPIMPVMFAQMPFDLLKDLEHVAVVGTSQFVIVTNANVPVNNIQELIAHVKTRPGKLTFASIGTGSLFHLGIELFKTMTGTDMLHVPYKSSGAAIADVAAGHIDVMFPTYASAKALIESGKLRLLAAGGSARMQMRPDVPTVNEAGVKGYAVDGWYGIAVPARTPESIVNRLAQELQAVLADPGTKTKLTQLGYDVYFEGPRELRQRIERDIAVWGKLAKDLGIKPE
jgi:tripartite-type tricarboxylate transporter receptor subunit TctC